MLSWEPGSDGLSPVRYYTVQSRELPDGEWALHSASVSHNVTAFVVDRLAFNSAVARWGAGEVMGSGLGSCPMPRFPHPMRSACAKVGKHWPMCPAGGRVAYGVIHRSRHHRPTLLPSRLKPFTSYKFRVKATNDIGDSEYSEESESLTTLQAGQSRLRLLGQGEGLPPYLGIPPCPGHL